NFRKNADTGWTIISKTCFFYDNYSGPALPSLDETNVVVKTPSAYNKTIIRPTIITHAGNVVPGYTLTGRKSMSSVPLFHSAVQRFIKE
ncbi:MAG: hypothetical protein ACM31E_03700, partial [Fibrobacterota bacterium]|nr:hypothetical protein [Chitinispirillaceae bacterium]